jgi:hypothetical protein
MVGCGRVGFDPTSSVQADGGSVDAACIPSTVWPGARSDFALTYDSGRHALLLHGGFLSPTLATSSETFGWDGTSWTLLASNGPALGYVGMAYSVSENRTILVGGLPQNADAGNRSSTTWAFGPAGWSMAATDVGSFYTEVGYNPTTSSVTAVLGFDGSISQNAQTWRNVWSTTPPLPDAKRVSGRLAFDAVKDGMFFFGGTNNASGPTDKSFFQASGQPSWSPVLGTLLTPSARFAHGMSNDSARNQIVVFGGQDAAGRDLGDTWIWTGTTWLQRFPITQPAPRSSQRMAYDPDRQLVWMFGGSPTHNELWSWNGDDWRAYKPCML